MAIVGHSGSVTAGGSAVGIAKIWSVDITADTVDTTTFGSNGWKENVQTLKGWSGNITVIYDGGADTGGSNIIDGLTNGTTVALELITSATGSGGEEKFSGNAIITSMPVTNDVNGVIEVSFAYVGTGSLTMAAIV